MLSRAIGAEFREVADREWEGKPAKAVVAARVYDTDADDLWDALTNAERIPRWFMPISGDLRLGGRYQLEGNAGGSIIRCDRPEALDVTWEFGGGMSWVTVRLAPDGQGVRLTLEHLMLAGDIKGDHWQQFGPGAVGVGWDLSFLGLWMHIESRAPVDRDAVDAWMAANEGKAFMRACADSWGKAHIASGEDPETARRMAAGTAAAYTGG